MSKKQLEKRSLFKASSRQSSSSRSRSISEQERASSEQERGSSSVVESDVNDQEL